MPVRSDFHRDHGLVYAGMLEDIEQEFPHGLIQQHGMIFRQRYRLSLRFDAHREALRGHLFGQGLQDFDQSKLMQHVGTQLRDQ